jgi:hypothetical protein
VLRTKDGKENFMQQNLVQAKIGKKEKVLLQRISRFAKSYISKMEGINEAQCSLRHMLTGACVYWNEASINVFSEFSTLKDCEMFPLTEVMYWSEDVKGEVANLMLDQYTSKMINNYLEPFETLVQGIVKEATLEGHRLTIDGVDFGRLDFQDLTGQLLLGMFLTYLLDHFNSSIIESEDYHRFIEPNDCIALRLNLFKYSELTSHISPFIQDEDVVPNVYYDFVFINGDKSTKIVVCDGGSSRKIDRHLSFNQGNGKDVISSFRTEPTSSEDIR